MRDANEIAAEIVSDIKGEQIDVVLDEFRGFRVLTDTIARCILSARREARAEALEEAAGRAQCDCESSQAIRALAAKAREDK